MRRTLACAALLVSALHAVPARAGEDEARAAMRRGLEAYQRGDPETAIAEYAAAKRLAPGANAPYFHSAQALVRMERWREAVQDYETYLAKDPRVSDAEEIKQRILQIRREHFPGHVRIASNAPNTTVIVDDMDRGPAHVIELAPGPHHFEIRAPAHESVTQDIIVVGGTETTAPFTLPKKRETAEPSTRADGGATDSLGPWRTAGWVTAGVGAATVVTTFLIDSIALRSAIDDYRTAVSEGRHDDARSLAGDVEGLRTGLVVGYSIGATLLVGGILVGLVAPRSSRSINATLRAPLRW